MRSISSRSNVREFLSSKEIFSRFDRLMGLKLSKERNRRLDRNAETGKRKTPVPEAGSGVFIGCGGMQPPRLDVAAD
jgi:hypothetical protein